jgi:tRNA A-37 threonylcarbamoyl transferase component Bud32/tetratricopeptide (TPR) repeat protein
MEQTRILHYEIGRLLGRGGMGEVYEARDTKLQRRVALKFIAPELSADAESAKRFEREALSAAALSHPHIATLFALEHDGRSTFIAMELVPGGSLRDRIARRPLAVAEALAIARDVAAALAHAHRRGVVHRDIKPENLMFDEEGAVKIMDFGLARAAQASRMTMTGTTLGTAAYMAPESTRGAIGAPADVFALGVTLYEMLAGALPFPGESPLALLYMIANEEPRPLRENRPEAPAEVEAVVMRMLVKDPGQRPDANAVTAELSALTGVAPPAIEPAAGTLAGPAAGLPVPMRTRGTEELEAEHLPARREEQALAPRRRRRALRWLVLVPLLLGAAWAGSVLVQRGLSTRGGSAAAERTLRARVLNDDALRFLQQGELDSARARAEAALAFDPASVEARLNLGQALRLGGQITRAADLFSQVTKAPSRDARLMAMAYSGLADLAMDDATWPAAVGYLRRAFDLDSSERAFSQLGYALVRAARPGEALALLRRGLRAYPGSAALHKNAGYALLALDSLAAARAEVERALALDAGFGPALGLRARLRARQGDAAGARADREAFLRARPGPADSAEVDADLRAAGALR